MLFTGCGSDDSGPQDGGSTTNSNTYESEDFKLSIPKNWEVIDKEDFTSNVPKEALLAVRNNIKSETFTANLNVSKIAVEENANLSDMVKTSLSKVGNKLIEFKEIESKEVELEVNDKKLLAYVTQFQGKQSASSPIIIFKQLHTIHKDGAYTVTIAYWQEENENVVEAIETMFDSFTLI